MTLSCSTRLGPPPATSGLRIGLLGGSFNPPHAGHRHISLMALKRLSLDRLWWLVTPGNPLKAKAELADFEHRLALARALAGHPKISVTNFEAALPSAYTIETLSVLKRRFPAVRFVWIMGADSFANFHLWKEWDSIMHLVPLAVFGRPGYLYAALASRAAHAYARGRISENAAAALALLEPPAWCYLTIPLSPLSSTQIRRADAAAASLMGDNCSVRSGAPNLKP